MKRSNGHGVQVVRMAAVAAVLAGVASAEARTAAPGQAPMTAVEVANLYRGKTWVWPDGGGYFAPQTGFKAWSGSGAKTSYAKGIWTVSDTGKLCMKAVWHVGRMGKANTTCFAHRVDGDVIYQRKLPSGQWYAFRSAPGKADDEFMKLKDGDLVSDKYLKIKSASR